MTRLGLPDDLEEALTQLGNSSDPDPEWFERVALWRRACGDAEGAATWQTWSLLPPEPDKLQNALAALWRRIGATDQAAALINEGWPQLALLLQQERWEEATTLQQKLLKKPPDVDVADLMELLQFWQQAERPEQALNLLQPLMGWMKTRGTPPSAQLCNVMADLLEKQERFDEAEPWWQRSHSLQPHQAWPLMRLGRQALRTKRPAVALHYASQVLSRDPAHTFAPRLQREALQALDATRSLALLDGTSLPAAEPTQSDSPPSELWQGCRSLALIGFRDAAFLKDWREQLDQPGADNPDTARPELWLIASPDPLWLEHHAADQLAGLITPVSIQSWPVWDEQRHHGADLVLEASDQPPGWQTVRSS